MNTTTAKPRSYFTVIERLEAWRSRASTSRHWSRGEEVDQLTQIIDELETEAETLADQHASVIEGQEKLKQQTVRIRKACGNVPEGMDTEEAVKRLKDQLREAESSRAELLAALEYAKDWIYLAKSYGCWAPSLHIKKTIRAALASAKIKLGWTPPKENT